MCTTNFYKKNTAILFALLIAVTACTSVGNKKARKMENMKENKVEKYPQGSYGYDKAFFNDQNIGTVELKNDKASALLIPDYQGRVMTSSANGNDGQSIPGYPPSTFGSAGPAFRVCVQRV